MIAALYVDLPRGPYARMDGVESWGTFLDARKYDGPWSVVCHPPCRHWSRLRHLAKGECCRCDWKGRVATCRRERDIPICPRCACVVRTDADCAPRAVEQVRKFGGVLEHPAGSKLWEACGLPRPSGGFSCRDCGADGSPCPSCGAAFCQSCAEKPYAFCCNGSLESVSATGEKQARLGHAASALDQGGALAVVANTTLDAWGGYSIEVDQCEWGHVARKPTWLYLVGVPRSALEAPPYPGRKPTHYASGGRTKSSRTGGAVPVGMKVCSAQQRRRTPPLLAEYLVRLAQAAAEARKAA